MPARVFVSFDWENDRHYKYLLEAWNANPRFGFVWADGTPEEIQSKDVSRVKAALTVKINNASHTLVIVGRYANVRHRDSIQIGYKNWINFEVAQSKANGNKLIAVKLEQAFETPDQLVNAGATWVYGFDESGIRRALEA
jgi:hypothetical protein